jgi:hypothetical protein
MVHVAPHKSANSANSAKYADGVDLDLGHPGPDYMDEAFEKY